MDKYLVTGGAGFIGSNIVERILLNGGAVRVLDNFSSGSRKNIQGFLHNPNFELQEGDISSIEVCRKAVAGMDFVIHQAASASVPGSIKDPIGSNNVNILGTLNLLVVSRDENIKKFVFASSCAVYGNDPEIPKTENSSINPASPYALTKYAGEKYAQLFWQIYGLPVICLRYFNVFGPKQNPNSEYAAVVPKFITAVLKGQGPTIFGDGNQTRDFVHVDNVVQANLLAAASKEGLGEVFNIASGQEISLNQLLEKIQKVKKKEIMPKYQEPQRGDIRRSKADISKAIKILGYDPDISVEDGLSQTIGWYEKNITLS